MADKRKPQIVMLLRIPSKKDGKSKVEIFNASDFKWTFGRSGYRLRVNGKWFDNKHKCSKYFNKSDILGMIGRTF